MLKVAITGNIASGKSSAEEIIKATGFKVLDTDIVAHELCENQTIKQEIVSSFKNYDILENGEISRLKLGAIVFANEEYRKKLEAILHPKIKEEIERFFRLNEDEKIAFVSVPLLFEAHFEKLFDKIILIYANDETRIERLIKRNRLSLEHAQNRINIQMSQDEKTSLADFVIYNNKSFEDLNIDVRKILNLL